MFELPEFVTLARQINETITGKVIKKGSRGNTPHKFVWYNRTPNEFGALTHGKTVGGSSRQGEMAFCLVAKLHPKHPINDLNKAQRRQLYRAILQTVNEIIAKGGRNDEFDLYNHPGGYRRIMDKSAAGHPCSECGTKIEKMQYLGGACYFCPRCQE